MHADSRRYVAVISDSDETRLVLKHQLAMAGFELKRRVRSVGGILQPHVFRDIDCIVVEATQWLFASQAALCLSQQVVGYTVPVFFITGKDSSREYHARTSLGFLDSMERPFTSSRFTVPFDQLLKRWEDSGYQALKNSGRLLSAHRGKEAVSILQSLAAGTGPVAQKAVLALAAFLQQIGKIPEAEKVLLARIRKSGKDFSVFLALAHLYLQHSMPKLAARLLKSVTTSFGPSEILIIPLIQSLILCDDCDGGLEWLEWLCDSYDNHPDIIRIKDTLMLASGRMLPGFESLQGDDLWKALVERHGRVV